MLARLLHQVGITATIFEGELSPDYRSQGGSLDLHEGTGLEAIREAGLFDSFLKHARYDSQALAVLDKHAKTWFSFGSSRPVFSKPEIDRADLRRILYESLPDETILWGHRLQRVDGHTLIFEHTSISGFDLIIGADGAFSKVRPALTSIKPLYSGVGGYQLKIPEAENKAPDVYKLVNRGTVFAFDQGKELGLQQLGNGGITVNYWQVRVEDWQDTCNVNISDSNSVRQAILDELQDWDSTLQNAVTTATGACQARSLFMLPVGTKWQHKRGMTLIGDAAHLMLHCAGEGVNLALHDARMLSEAIIAALNEDGGSDTLDRHVARFEVDMFKRATKAQEMTDKMRIASFFTPGAPRTSLPSWILARAKYDVHPWLYPLAFIWFHLFYFVYKLFHY